MLTINETIIYHKIQLPHEKAKSSTWRELAAIEFALQSFKEVQKGSNVKWLTDNPVAAKITTIGRMHFDFHLIAL